MHDTTALVRPAANDYTPADNPRFVKLHRRFPTVAYLRRHARRHVPRFAFEYMDGGAGADTITTGTGNDLIWITGAGDIGDCGRSTWHHF